MRYRSWSRLLALAFGACFVACGGSSPPLPTLETVPYPDLSSFEVVPREQLMAREREVRSFADRGRGEPREAASAYGGLGELYHAYGLSGPALACYRNAALLDPEAFRWPYYLGLLHQEEGDFETASEAFERALVLRPDRASAHLRLGEMALMLGEPAQAGEAFEAAIGDDSFLAAARYGLGRVAAAEQRWPAAVLAFEEVLELQPEATVARHPLALAYRESGQLERARELLAQEASGEVRFPDPQAARLEGLAVSSGAHLRRGNRALVAGDNEAAIKAFRAAVDAKPDYSEARRNLALALMRAGQSEAAARELEAALETDPENVWLHHDLGTAFQALGRGEAAAQAFRRAIELAPDFSSALFNLGNTFAAMERWEEASEPLGALLELEPGNGRARYLAAMALHKQGRSAAAVARLESLLADEPANLVAREGLASVHVENKRLARAYEVFAAVRDVHLPAPEREKALLRLAELAWKKGDQQVALGHFREAVSVAPESSSAHTALANALQLADRLDEAGELFARATELEPSNATAWLSEASIWILEGRFAHARERLEAALEHVPGHVGLSHTLARLLATSPDSSVRDGARALTLARQALTVENKLDYAETVGMAMAEMGRFEEAIQWQRSLAAQAAQRGDRALAGRLASRMALYERRQPVRIEAP